MSKIILTSTCRNCDHKWQPLGNEPMPIPYSSEVKCPVCSERQNEIWIDEETRVKITRKKLGLESNQKIDDKIQTLEQKISLLESKLSLESKSRELLENEIKEIKSWISGKEKIFQIIEITANEIEEEEKKFSNNNK